MNGGTIALVDDDRNILTSVSMALKAEGYTVRSYQDGRAGYEGIAGAVPDLAILDVKMPRMDGIETLRKLRDNPLTAFLPVIFLTSKDDETDQLAGFAQGADDYITKPFSQALLLARIRTLMRRTASRATPKEARNQIVRGSLILDDTRHDCFWKGAQVNLTVTEYLLLRALADRPGHVKTRDQLIDLAYGETLDVEDRSVDSHIKRLRKKLRGADPNFSHIETLYGIGYKYTDTTDG